MQTIAITQTFQGDIDEMVGYARSLRSRLNWPGAVLAYEEPGVQLSYSVGMRLKATHMIDVEVEETLSDVEPLEDSDGVVFSTVNKSLWPDGHMTCIAEYRFVPGADGERHTLHYSYSYPPPSSKLVKPRQQAAFDDAMERVCNRFVKGLLAHGTTAELAAATPVPAEPMSVSAEGNVSAVLGQSSPVATVSSVDGGVAGMETVVATVPFDGDLDAMVAYTRTLKSRLNWPGAVLEHEQEDRLFYQVGMQFRTVMTDLSVEERLGPVDHPEEGAARYSASHRVLWPSGLHADALSVYVFSEGDGTTPNTLRFTYSYPPPSTKLIKTRELPKFRAAMERVCERYLQNLVKAA